MKLLANDRADFYKSKPVIVNVSVNPLINQDSSLKCVYFDGRLEVDGLNWAEYIVHHRVYKETKYCNSKPCNGHPDIVIGPVADGKVITANAIRVIKGELSSSDFYQNLAEASWFPHYKQIVFGQNAIKYLNPL